MTTMGGRGEQVGLPPESFAEMAFELRLMARELAVRLGAARELVTWLEARMSIDPLNNPPPSWLSRAEVAGLEWSELPSVRLQGCRDAVADLDRRARFVAAMVGALTKFAAREDEVRALFMPARPRGACRWVSITTRRWLRQAGVALALGGVNAT